MPVEITESFDFLGSTDSDEAFLSGFPRRTIAVDVLDDGTGSEYSHWQTLGGTRKGNDPTPEEIALSWQNAAKLYWRWNQVEAEFADGMGFFQGLVADATTDGVSDISYPIDRRIDGALGSDEVPPFYLYGIFTQGIARMFRGSTFLGYGIETGTGPSLPPSSDGFMAFENQGAAGFFGVLLGSYISDSIVLPNFLASGDGEVDYCTFGDIPMVCAASGDAADASALQAGDSGGATFNITSIDFYVPAT